MDVAAPPRLPLELALGVPGVPGSPRALQSPFCDGRRRLDAFDIVCLIGKGGFGKVFLVRHKATAAVYAMKVMEKELLVRRKAVRDAVSERDILALVGEHNSPFIVTLHVAFQTTRRVYLVMDFASGGELMFHLRNEAMFSEEVGRFYAAQLLLAIEFLHDMHICHRDIKPENVLLGGDGHLILTDFGLAKELTGLGDQTHSWCGSEDYMAPETLARESHTGKPADYWAYGVFIYDCLCGEPPFSPLHEKGKLTRKRLHDRILKCKVKLPGFLSRECHSLLRALLTRDPARRLTDPAAIRAHPWFASINWDLMRNKQMTPPITPCQGSPTACFSPSLTKVDYSAPHSPLVLSSPTKAAPAASAAMPIPGVPMPPVDHSVWQGFSFVAPGMDVHFELAPSAVDRGDGVARFGSTNGSALAGSPPPLPSFIHPSNFPSSFSPRASPPQSFTNPVELEQLVAELAEFSVDKVEAVEIVDTHV